MRRPSQLSLQLKQKQALIIHKHGYSVEVLGQDLQRRKRQSAQLLGQLIEECGKSIQHKAQESLTCTNLLLQPGFNCEQLYEQAVTVQAEARRLYIQALVMYLQVVQESLRTIEQYLQLPAINNIDRRDSSN